MENKEKQLRTLVRNIMSEMDNVNEHDLIMRAGLDWNRVKSEFANNVNSLIQKIDDDQYDDAEDLIGKAIVMLKMWKHKIKKGKEMVNREPHSITLDEENL